jgi:hypothetical protein
MVCIKLGSNPYGLEIRSDFLEGVQKAAESRHLGGRRGPNPAKTWIPAFAGMTKDARQELFGHVLPLRSAPEETD